MIRMSFGHAPHAAEQLSVYPTRFGPHPQHAAVLKQRAAELSAERVHQRANASRT
jgi:hypothetical protein